MNAATETPTAPLTFAAVAQAFAADEGLDAKPWQGKRIYLNGFSVGVYLTVSATAIHAVIARGTLSGAKWQRIWDRIERVTSAHGWDLEIA